MRFVRAASRTRLRRQRHWTETERGSGAGGFPPLLPASGYRRTRTQGVRLCSLPYSAQSDSRRGPPPSGKRSDGKEQSLTPWAGFHHMRFVRAASRTRLRRQRHWTETERGSGAGGFPPLLPASGYRRTRTQGVRLCSLPYSAQSDSRRGPPPSGKRSDGKEQSLTPWAGFGGAWTARTPWTASPSRRFSRADCTVSEALT
jgi:hypothetical protein